MGLIRRTLTPRLVPRSVRRATHPVRTVRRAATPRSIKQASGLLHPVNSAVYGATPTRRRKPRTSTARTTQTPPVVRPTPKGWGWLLLSVFVVAPIIPLGIWLGWPLAIGVTLGWLKS